MRFKKNKSKTAADDIPIQCTGQPFDTIMFSGLKCPITLSVVWPASSIAAVAVLDLLFFECPHQTTIYGKKNNNNNATGHHRAPRI